jgi:hypothetical protein
MERLGEDEAPARGAHRTREKARQNVSRGTITGQADLGSLRKRLEMKIALDSVAGSKVYTEDVRMLTSLHRAKSRVVAVTVIAAVALIAVTAGAVALSMTLTVAQHACCHHEVDASCLTLCAASESGAALTFVEDQAPRLANATWSEAPETSGSRMGRPEPGGKRRPRFSAALRPPRRLPDLDSRRFVRRRPAAARQLRARFVVTVRREEPLRLILPACALGLALAANGARGPIVGQPCGRSGRAKPVRKRGFLALPRRAATGAADERAAGP